MSLRLAAFLSMLGMLSTSAFAQLPTPLPLWNGPAPQSHGAAASGIPTLTPFFPTNAGAPAPAVIICPGGGYAALCMDREGTNVAQWFQTHGAAAFVLKYRLPSQGYRHPVPLLDAKRALRLVRSRAAEWKIDPAKIGIMGFSAGGHLASTLETHFDAGHPQASDPVDRQSCCPNFAVLVYPVISMKDGITNTGSKNNLLGPNPDPALVASLSNETQVTPQTPPTIIVVAKNDSVVPIQNSELMYAALQKAGVPSALQEYPQGDHGFGYGGVPDHSPAGWLDRVGDWLKNQGFLP